MKRAMKVKSDLVWVYLKEHAVESLYDCLMKIYEGAEENDVIIVASGNKNLSQLNELSILLVCFLFFLCFSCVDANRMKLKKAKAIQDGNIKEAEEYAAKIRNENANAKQYPFWIFAKHNDDK